MTQEPYFELEDFSQPIGCGDRAHLWGFVEEVHYNQTLRQQEKFRFYKMAMDMISNNRIMGDYWEFGCHKARTFRMAMQEAYRHEFTRNRMNFHAFDSFEGLPQNDKGMEEWGKGCLCTTSSDFLKLVQEMPNFDRVVIHEGFYQDTLPKFETNTAPAIVCVDCDLYESAVPVFQMIEKYIQQGTIIYIDDFNVGYKGNPREGVSKAFREFSIKSKWNHMELMTVGWWGRSYITTK